MTPILTDLEHLAQKIGHGFAVVFHAIEHEVPMVLTTLVNVYGPEVVAHAVATYHTNVTTFVDKEAAVAEADLKALVQSSLVDKFHLPPTAAQFIASGVHHLFTVGEDKVNTLIDAGAASLEAQADPAGPTQPPAA